MITAALLRRVMPRLDAATAELWAPHIEAARVRWVGDRAETVAHWLAQIAHESGELRYVAEVWGPTDAQLRYDGRHDLGNDQPGDGYKFRGRGLLQLTGRFNYGRAAADLGLPLLDHPELLEQPEHAAASAGWYWHTRGIGTFVDAADPVLVITKRINGGTNGLEERRRYTALALAALHDAATEPQPAGAMPPAPSSSPTPVPEPAPAAPAAPEYVDPMETPEERAARETWARHQSRARTDTDGLTADAPTPSPVAAPNSPGGTMPLPLAAVVSLGTQLLQLLPIAQKKPEQVGKIEQLAQALVGIAQQVAPGAVNEQQAVQQVQANPQLRQQFVAKAVEQWSDIAPYLEYESRERKAARDFGDAMTSSGPVWRQIGFGVLIAILAIGILGGIGYLFHDVLFTAGERFSQSTRDGIVEVLKNIGVLIVGYFFGSSASSRGKDVAIQDQTRR